MVDYVKLDEDWPTYLHKKLKEDWVLSSVCRDNCECYFLRHWEVSYLISQPQFEECRLEYNGTVYHIHFMDKELHKLGQCALSFRKPKPELNLPAYVLVKGIAS